MTTMPNSIFFASHSIIFLWMRLVSLMYLPLTFAHHSLFTKWYNSYKLSARLDRSALTGMTPKKSPPMRVHASMLYVNIYERQSAPWLRKIPDKARSSHSNFGVEEARWRSWAFVVAGKLRRGRLRSQQVDNTP